MNDVLGFSSKMYRSSTSQRIRQAELEVDLLRGISSIFIYCDICEPIRIGTEIAPLLRTVAYNNVKYGEVIHLNYVNPMYIRVNKSFIDTIQIQICDATGEIVPFAEGLTTCTLHFKRI